MAMDFFPTVCFEMSPQTGSPKMHAKNEDLSLAALSQCHYYLVQVNTSQSPKILKTRNKIMFHIFIVKRKKRRV